MSGQSLAFTVYGKPEPQGSIRAFMPKGGLRPVLTSTNRNLKPWRQQVALAAVAQVGVKDLCEAIGEAFGIEVTFYLAKPRSVSKKRLYPVVKPDLDKLARAVCDALTSIAYRDDSQICDAIIRKRYGAPERTEIRVWLLEL